MADEDDKVRRNLVVVSGVILATAFLELPVNGVIDIFANTPDPFKAIPQSKFWAIGLTLLAYLLARYRFSDDGKNMVEVVTNTRRNILSSLAEDEIRLAADEFNLSGTVRPSISDLGIVIEELRKDSEANGQVLEKLVLELNDAWEGLGDLTKIPFSLSYERPTKSVNLLNIRPTFSATFTPQQKFYFKCRASLIGYAYSEGAIQKLAPVIFASLAILTLWFRIASRIVDDWPF